MSSELESPPAPGAALTLTRVTWREGSSAEGVSMHVPAGQSVALHSYPPEDASALLDILGGLRRPRSGQVLVDDTAVDQLSGAALDAYLADRGVFSVRFRPAGGRSGEQQWRVMIAQVLRTRPRLMLAEDPVSALDAQSATIALDMLTDVHARVEFTLLLTVGRLATAARFQRLIRLIEGTVADDEMIGQDPCTRGRVDRIG